MQLLHHVIRPDGSRDDCGEVGEALHQLADTLEIWFPMHAINVDYAGGQRTAETWRNALNTLEQVGLTESAPHAKAIDRLRQLAEADALTP